MAVTALVVDSVLEGYPDISPTASASKSDSKEQGPLVDITAIAIFRLGCSWVQFG